MKRYLFNLAAFVFLLAAGYFIFNAFSFGPAAPPLFDLHDGTAPLKSGVFPDHRTCATMDNYERLIKLYPEYKKNREALNEFTQDHEKTSGLFHPGTVVTIPVIVHVVYNTAQQNISDDQIYSQIDVLNADYRRHNLDTSNTPAPFKPVGGDAQIQFCMAHRDPSGNPTLGIRRVQTTVQSFTDNDFVKYTALGGDDAWDRNKYLNVWVCNLGDNLLGYAQFPGGPAASDGVVILYTAYGSVGNVQPPYNLGRTATHEIGHWLNLIHIWGDDNGACTGSDQVADTPNQGSENYGCPGFPKTDSCSASYPGVMFMNYMDYTDDGCMNIFTMGQVSRITAALTTYRAPIMTSNGCTNVSGTPICSFSADSLSIMYGGSVHYADNSAGIPTSWNWTFAGGNPPNAATQNPAVIYTTPGYYTARLRISNSFGSDSVTKVNYIKVRGANMNSFSIVSPPSFTRIVTSPNDPSTVDFTWTKSVTAPLITYKIKFRKLGSSFDYSYSSNNSGADTIISIRKSFLDTLANVIGLTGDSVRCSWRTWVYNGVDSVQSTNSFIVSFVANPIGIQRISTSVPDNFSLYNNYPNPFNPTTIIKFDVPANVRSETSNVKLIVYDVLGRQIAVLVNQNLKPGNYEVNFDASNYPSGIYFYKLESADYVNTKKMVLVK